MRSIATNTLVAAFACLLAAAPACAEVLSQPTTVIELFTSQGCSSCPPANEYVTDLDASREDVLSLSYGVSYWDYLGWEDTFAHPKFMVRQRLYDKALNSGIYTPMLVVGGVIHAPKMTDRRIDGVLVPQKLSLVRRSGDLCIQSELPAGATLALVNYKPGIDKVDVESGENRDRTLTFANVVTDVTYHDWSGEMICGLDPKSALAVLAHDADTGAIIAAARLEP